MKQRINKLKTVLTAPFPALLCTIASILPEWLPWILFIIISSWGTLVWVKYKKEKCGVVMLVISLFCVAIGIYNAPSNKEHTVIAEIGEDPIQSFFSIEDYQKAEEYHDVNYLEALASVVLFKSIKGDNYYSFSYYDNIWRKLESAKRAGSARACCDMAIMCLLGLGRPQSLDEAIECCQKAISLDPHFYSAYSMLEELHIDSVKYAETYAMVTNWREELKREFNDLENCFDMIDYDKYDENSQKDTMGIVLDEIVKQREQSFREVLCADTLSKYWKLIHDNIRVLSFMDNLGDTSFNNLYLAAYYYSINKTDSALYFYDKFLKSDYVSRAHAQPLPLYNSFIPDTIINVYSKDIKPLLLGASFYDLAFICECVYTRLPWIENTLDSYIDLYFAYSAICALQLKRNRCLFEPVDGKINFTSKINTITRDFLTGINKVIENKKTIIGHKKSRRYDYNFFIDLKREAIVNCVDENRKIMSFDVISDIPQKADTTFIFYNSGDGENLNEDKKSKYYKQYAAEFRLLYYLKYNKSIKF